MRIAGIIITSIGAIGGIGLLAEGDYLNGIIGGLIFIIPGIIMILKGKSRAEIREVKIKKQQSKDVAKAEKQREREEMLHLKKEREKELDIKKYKEKKQALKIKQEQKSAKQKQQVELKLKKQQDREVKKAKKQHEAEEAFRLEREREKSLRELEPNNTHASLGNLITQNTPLIQDEIKNLLWFSNGPLKNFNNPVQNIKSFEYNGFAIKVTSAGPEEPSVIDRCAIVHKPQNIYDVPRPPYFPSYNKLSPEQKWLYWNFLSTPYSGEHDIGYVFIFYYGLERHLFEGKFEDAFNVVLKLRDVYANPSFQSYSAYALLLSCILKQNADYARIFLESIDKEHELNFSPHLYFFCKAAFNIPVSADDILLHHRAFSFTNNRYIKNNTKLFRDTLNQKIKERFGDYTFKISDTMTDKDWGALEGVNVPIFANVSLRGDNYVAIPNFILTSWGDKVLLLLQDTHETVKKFLADQRKIERKRSLT